MTLVAVNKQTSKPSKIMNKTSVKTGKTLRVFGTILLIGTMPLLLGVTGCATGNRYEQSTGERIDDHGTSSRVRSALADDAQYKYGSVNVETFKGTVQLSGFVNSRDQKNRAADLAKQVASVKEVVNNITVKESVN
jgi:hyperosmotically inducible periplasmic protein